MAPNSGDTGERFLVTGALGCIGAWAVRRLLAEAVEVWTYDLPGDPHRLRLIIDEADLARVHVVEGDITNPEAFDRVVANSRITHVVHLAALQVPFVKADAVRGAQVNVVGMAVVMEALRRHAGQVRGFSYASSVGVYGPAENYPDRPLAHDAPLDPPTLYGVYKQADEGMARIYWRDHQLPSIGLRPYVVYGPGRDQGMTSTPTKAMLAATLAQPFHISFGGTAVFQHADDVAAAFIAAARARPQRADVYNLGGSTASMEVVVAAIEAVAPEIAGRLTFEPISLPHPSRIDDGALKTRLGEVSWRPLALGVQQTIDCFRTAVAHGQLDTGRILGAPGQAGVPR